MKHRYLRSAANEFSRAVDYYLDVDPLLAKRFVREVEASLRRILTHPQAWKPLRNAFRRCRVKHFPYGLVYRVERDALSLCRSCICSGTPNRGATTWAPATESIL